MAERLRRVHPQRHPCRPAQRRRLGHRLDQAPVRRHVREVHEGRRIAGQDRLQVDQVDGSVAAARQLRRPKTTMPERSQIGPPLARQHRHRVPRLQRPRSEQRLQRGGRALDERQPLRPDAEQPGQRGPGLFQHRLRFGFGDVGSDRCLALGLRRGRPQRGRRAAAGGRRVEVQQLGRVALLTPAPPRLGKAVAGCLLRPEVRFGHVGNCPMRRGRAPSSRSPAPARRRFQDQRRFFTRGGR